MSTFERLAIGILDALDNVETIPVELSDLFNEINPPDLAHVLLKVHAGRAAANELLARAWDCACGCKALREGLDNPFRTGTIRFPERGPAAATPSTES